MTYERKNGKPPLVTKENAILGWELRHPDATEIERARAMRRIEKRFAPKLKLSTFAEFKHKADPMPAGGAFRIFEETTA